MLSRWNSGKKRKLGRRAGKSSGRRPLGQGFEGSIERLETRDLLTQYTWIGGNTGDFNTAANWQGSTPTDHKVPGPHDTAFIQQTNVTVTSNKAVEVQGIDCNGTLELDAATFKVDDNNPNISGITTLNIKSGATFDANTNGAMVLTNGDCAGALSIENAASVSIKGNMNFHNARLSGQGELVVYNNPTGVVEFSGPVDATGLTGTLVVKQGPGAPFSTLAIDSNVHFSVANFELDNGGAVTGAGSLTVTKQFNVSGGKLDVQQSTVASSATLTISGPNPLTLDGSTLTNLGTANWNGGDLDLNAATIDNASGATWKDSSYYNSITGTGTFTNEGSYNKPTQSSTTVISANFHNTNTGAVSVGAGTLEFEPGTNQADSAGAITVGPGVLDIADGTFALAGGSISGGGSIYIVNGGTIHVTGPVADTNTGTLFIAPGPNQAWLTVDQNFAVPHVELDGAGMLNGMANLTVINNMNLAGGTMAGPGTTTIAPVATLTITAGGTLNQRTLNNAGTTAWNGGNLRLAAATAINNFGAWQDNGDHELLPLAGVQGGLVANSGSYAKTGGSGTSSIQVAFNNSGSVAVNTGTLELQAPQGTDDVSTGSFALTGGSLSIDAGALDLNAGTKFTGSRALVIGYNGTLNVNANVPVAGPVTNNGNLVLAAATTLAVGGSYAQPSGTLTVDIAGSAALGQFGKLPIVGTATLNGTIQAKVMGGYVPAGGQIYTVMSYASETGSLNLATPSPFTLVINPTNMLLNTQAVQNRQSPTSSVNPLPATSPSTFTVAWTGSDAGGPGIASYNIYVSDNGGPFTLALSQTTLTSATYNGQPGHTYGFYSVAVDSQGMRQPTPAAAQATTHVAQATLPPTANPDTFVLSQLGPNAGSGTMSVLANDTSADGQPQQLVATLVSNVTHGSLTFNPNGSFIYTPNSTFQGIDRFTYEVSEGTAIGNTVTVTLLSYHASLVDKLYQQVLHRSAEDAGLVSWTSMLDQGAPLDVVAKGIFTSPERLDPLVTQFYENYLGRAPDSGGLSAWVSDWQQKGDSDDVVVNILASQEFFNDAGGTNQGFVELLYERFLGRAGEASGVSSWVGMLNSGQTRQQVASDFVGAPERHVELVDYLFGEYFKGVTPTPDPTPYVNLLNSGETQTQVEQAIIDSTAYDNTPPQPAQGTVGTALYQH